MDFPHPVGVWVKQSPTEGKPSPDLLYEGGATWDPYAKRLIHHAGHDRIAQGHHVFEFDLLHQGWQQIFPDDSPPGACLVDGAMTFDLVHRRATRWSGLSLNHGSQFSREVKLKRSWIWLYDAAKMEWANMRPPPYETAGDTGFPVGAVTNSQAVTFDRRRAVVLSHGGISAPGGRVVSYDAYDNSIEIAASNDNAPSERDDHAFAADPVHDRYYVWGSQYASDPALYIYHPQDGTWEKRTLANTPPYDRSMPRMACDGVTHRCLVVGRDSATGRMFTSLLDTKDYTWTSITTPMPPDALKSRGLNLSYAPDLNVYVLELQTSTDREEVWTFRVEEAPVPQGPAAPSTLKVTTSATSAHLEWDASPAAQSYRIYRGTGTNSRTVKLALLDEVTGVAFDDDAVPTDGIAYYEVRAVADGQESAYGPRARARPPVPKMPVVTVVDAHHVRLGLAAGGGADVVGFNVYRGVAEVATTMGGEPIVSAYGYNNDAPYDSARVVSVKNITGLARLNEAVVAADSFEDATVDLATPLPASGGSPTAVYAYVVRAVNRLGVESGPSPYQLTIPSAPRSVMIDDRTSDAVLRWEPPREGAVRYRIYAIPTNGQVVEVTPGTLTTTSATLPGVDGARYTVTAIDVLGQEGQPSSPVWFKRSYPGFFTPPWHQ
ncbi:MAG: fibronectin type III domain-containing protein [Bacteroidia bacterium]|nr:fibronectin type III domain-containing protein [Bacteroidia bacterium]